MVVDFGKRLKELRRRAGLTQKQLADRMQLKQQSNISLWEGRSTPPRLETVDQLALALGYTRGDLMRGVRMGYEDNHDAHTNGAAEKPTKGRARTPLEQPTAKRRRASSG